MYAVLAKAEGEVVRVLGTIVEPVREYGRALADRFKRNFVAAASNLVSVSPILMMIVAVVTLARAEVLSNSTHATPITWFCSTLSARIHTISIWRTFATILAASVSAGLILGLLSVVGKAIA
jgi:hypothetical protein